MQSSSFQLSSGQPVRAVADGFFRHWRLFLIVLSSVVILVVSWTLLAKKQYRSEMEFLLENNRGNDLITADRSSAPAATEITEQQINSELEILASEDVIGAIADPGWAALSAEQRTPEARQRHEKSIASFRKRLKIEPSRKSNVISVSFTGDSSQEATDSLGRYSNAYLAHRKLLSRPRGTSKFFADEAHRYQQAWEEANGRLVDFQQQNHIVSVGQTEETLSKAIDGYQDDLRTAQASLSEINGRLHASSSAVQNIPPRQQSQERVTRTMSNAESLRTLLVGLENRRTELLTRYMPTNRLVKEVERQIGDTQKALDSALAQMGVEDTTDINPTYQQLQSALVDGRIEKQATEAKASALQQDVNVLRAQLSQLQALDVRFNVLQESADQARSNYELFSEKRDQAQIEDLMDDQKLVNIAVAESPTSSFKPASPKPMLNAALGLLTALFLAAGAVYFAESGRSTVANAAELEGLSRFPVLATIPHGALQTGNRHGGCDSPVISNPQQLLSRVGRMMPAMQNFQKANEV
jgi:uncharacterized protein involved in exopolysaccharide biosynthesis